MQKKLLRKLSLPIDRYFCKTSQQVHPLVPRVVLLMCFLSISGPVSCSCLRRRRPRRRGQRRGRLGEWGRSGRRTLFAPAPADDIDVRLRAAERKPILPTGKMIKELCRESANLILAIIIVGKDLCPLELLLLSANVEGRMRDYLQKSAYYSPTSARIKNEVIFFHEEGNRSQARAGNAVPRVSLGFQCGVA